MKKIVSLILALAMVISCFSCVALAEDEIKITLNGTALTMDQPPVIVEGRTLVPVRAIFEALGATVSWNDATKTAMGVLGSKTISLQIDNKVAKVDGKDVTLDVPAQIINSRTLVPVRFISESLGLKVNWDGNTRTVIIEGESSIKLYKEWTFDNTTEFKNNTHYILGGAYQAENVSVSDKYDVNGNGNALVLANKDKSSYRVKIKNVFTKDDLGKTFTIEAKVLTPEDAGKVMIGLYSDTNTAYATKPIITATQDTKKNEWTLVSLTYKHEDEIITQLGLCQPTDAKPVKTIVFDDIKIYEGNSAPVVTPNTDSSLKIYKDWNFDNTTEFKNNTHYILGGAYQAENVSVSDKYDVNGNGNALVLANKDKSSYRVKIKNVFTKDDLGKTFTIEAKVLTPEDAGKVMIGLYSDTNTAYATKPIITATQDTKKNEWTLVSLTYKHEDEIITQLGLCQPTDAKPVKTIVFDDIKIYEGAKEEDPSNPRPVKEHELLAEGVSVVKDGHRPVPTNFKTGKNYEDIIYYGKDLPDNDALVSALPKGEVIANDSAFDTLLEVNKEFGKVEIVTVEGMPFTKALRATCTKIPPNAPYQFQAAFDDSFLKGKAENGDVCLLKLYMRTIESQKDESGNGHIMPIIEMNVAPNAKKVASDIIHGKEWKVFYFPFEYDSQHTRGTLRFGYALQTVEVGGYEIINYKKDVTIDKLPTNEGMPASQREDAAWRSEAWDRIEQIRKSDIKVIVKDSNGNVIPNANVKVNMYETEFEWGTAIGSDLLSSATYQKILSENFNSVVSENDNKWNYYLKDPTAAKNQFEVSRLLGIKNFRGHALVWDKASVNNGVNSAMPDDLPNYFDNYDELQKIINKHIDDTMKDFEYCIGDWDVLNEAQRADMRIIPKYGTKIIKEWFDMARSSGVKADLYYNDYIVGTQLVDFIKSLIDAGVDFDGVGLQSHHNQNVADITLTMKWWQQIAAMGKRMKITEYDFATDDELLQASYTRDFMIAVYSMEAFDGFIMWGCRGGENNARVLYTSDFTPRLSLEVWQDLIYNKWWTNEEGTTDANGTFATSGFHGDYDITVSANGKTKTVTAQCYKGNDNTIVVTLD